MYCTCTSATSSRYSDQFVMFILTARCVAARYITSACVLLQIPNCRLPLLITSWVTLSITNRKCCPLQAHQRRLTAARSRKERVLQRHSNWKKLSSSKSKVCLRTSSQNLLGSRRLLLRGGRPAIRIIY